MSVRKKVTLPAAVGVAMKLDGHWALPGTQAGKAPSRLCAAEALGLTCCVRSSFNCYERTLCLFHVCVPRARGLAPA